MHVLVFFIILLRVTGPSSHRCAPTVHMHLFSTCWYVYSVRVRVQSVTDFRSHHCNCNCRCARACIDFSQFVEVDRVTVKQQYLISLIGPVSRVTLCAVAYYMSHVLLAMQRHTTHISPGGRLSHTAISI